MVVHLRSKAWDTRLAAGQALEAIAEHVPTWDPVSGDKGDDDTAHKLGFDQFDLASVITHGKLLLGSAGKEYDIDLSDMSPQERLELQRKNLKDRLGLTSQFMDGTFHNSYFSSFFSVSLVSCSYGTIIIIIIINIHVQSTSWMRPTCATLSRNRKARRRQFHPHKCNRPQRLRLHPRLLWQKSIWPACPHARETC